MEKQTFLNICPLIRENIGHGPYYSLFSAISTREYYDVLSYFDSLRTISALCIHDTYCVGSASKGCSSLTQSEGLFYSFISASVLGAVGASTIRVFVEEETWQPIQQTTPVSFPIIRRVYHISRITAKC